MCVCVCVCVKQATYFELRYCNKKIGLIWKIKIFAHETEILAPKYPTDIKSFFFFPSLSEISGAVNTGAKKSDLKSNSKLG